MCRNKSRTVMKTMNMLQRYHCYLSQTLRFIVAIGMSLKPQLSTSWSLCYVKLVCNIRYVPYFVVFCLITSTKHPWVPCLFSERFQHEWLHLFLYRARDVSGLIHLPLAQKARNDSQISEKHAKDSLDGEKIFRWFVLRQRSVKFQVTYLKLAKNKFVTKQTRKGTIRSDHYKKIRNFCQPGFYFKRQFEEPFWTNSTTVFAQTTITSADPRALWAHQTLSEVQVKDYRSSSRISWPPQAE